MTETTLFIDYRERSGLEKGVIKHCEKEGIPYQMQENLITDYCFGSMGIEAKSIHDYFNSLHSGHLQNQLANMDDNFERMVLVIHGTVDQYVAALRKRGNRSASYAQMEARYIGSLARFDVDYDITIMQFSTASAAARWIVKRCQKDGTLGSSNTLRTLRKTRSEDVRIDGLRALGCSETIAKNLLEHFGSIVELTGATKRELMNIEGVGKKRAEDLHQALTSEQPVVKQTHRKTMA